jgi:hypothetical protein
MTFTEPMIATFDLSVGNSPLSIPSDRTTLFYDDPSESTVATYISIFETLWMQNELQELM